MESTVRCMEKVTKRITKLKEHEMFDDLPDELKETLFNIGAQNETKSKL